MKSREIGQDQVLTILYQISSVEEISTWSLYIQAFNRLKTYGVRIWLKCQV